MKLRPGGFRFELTFILSIVVKQIFSGDFEVEFRINEKCANVIKDFERLLVGDDGGWIKKMVSNKTGQRYQELGHCADAITYFFARILPELFYTKK